MSPLAEAISLSVVGIGSVFLALILTGGLVLLIQHFTQDKPVEAPPKPLPEATPLPGVIDKRKVVLLAAAATVACKRPVRIRRIRFVTHKHIPSSWAAAGRTDHVQESL